MLLDFFKITNVDGMKRWGIRGDKPINRYKPCQRALRLKTT